MKKQSDGFFWPSFTDLMICLFFVMLVLYVFTYIQLNNTNRITIEKLKYIENIYAAIKQLDTNIFAYDTLYKRFKIKRNIQFQTDSDVIPENDKEYVRTIGEKIQVLINSLESKNDTNKKNIMYLIIIEGMASKGGSDIHNYNLSYNRALSVYNLWKENATFFDENKCEIQISGSGSFGVGRSKFNSLNQRILIQILPKLDDIN